MATNRRVGAPRPRTDGGVSARLAIHLHGYARFSQHAYDALGVDPDAVDAVAIYKNADHIGFEFRARGETQPHPAVTVDVDGDHVVELTSEGRFNVNPVVRQLFAADVSALIDERQFVEAEWRPADRRWVVAVDRLAAALEPRGGEP